jgi:hypothetical protein
VLLLTPPPQLTVLPPEPSLTYSDEGARDKKCPFGSQPACRWAL